MLPNALCLILNILVFQPVLCFYTSPETFDKHIIILWAPIYALAGHICIYDIAKLQTISQRQLQTVAEPKKPLILFFFPRMDESLEKWILSPRQEDISVILWGHQGCTERCVVKAIFVSLRPMVEAGLHDPNRSLYHNKCPWTLCLWSTAYRVGFPRSIGDW